MCLSVAVLSNLYMVISYNHCECNIMYHNCDICNIGERIPMVINMVRTALPYSALYLTSILGVRPSFATWYSLSFGGIHIAHMQKKYMIFLFAIQDVQPLPAVHPYYMPIMLHYVEMFWCLSAWYMREICISMGPVSGSVSHCCVLPGFSSMCKKAAKKYDKFHDIIPRIIQRDTLRVPGLVGDSDRHRCQH